MRGAILAGVSPDVIAGFVLTPHARWEMQRRGIEGALVEAVLASAEQRVVAGPGRDIYQSRLSLGEPPRTYLVRVVVDVDRRPPEIVTAYRTSKIAKYWRAEE